jgi:hypothetical protein
VLPWHVATFLQEIDDAIRDAAEENQSTYVTPPVLASCLKKAHPSMDDSTVEKYVIRYEALVICMAQTVELYPMALVQWLQ